MEATSSQIPIIHTKLHCPPVATVRVRLKHLPVMSVELLDETQH